MTEMSPERKVAAIAAISDPLRRALFDLVSRSPEPVGRDDAATQLGLPRSTAAFHLDRLVDDGALAVEYRRLGGKTGPGSGRPSKLYRRAADELSASVPDRRYELMGDLLASAVTESIRTGETAAVTLPRVAEATGRELGASAGSLRGMMEETGFEPSTGPDGTVALLNCPFHRLAAAHTEVVCAANVGLLTGAARGAGDESSEVVFSPHAGRCCVLIVPTEHVQGAHS